MQKVYVKTLMTLTTLMTLMTLTASNPTPMNSTQNFFKESTYACIGYTYMVYFCRVSLITVPLTAYRNRKIVNCLFSKTSILTAGKLSAILIVVFENKQLTIFP